MTTQSVDHETGTRHDHRQDGVSDVPKNDRASVAATDQYESGLHDDEAPADVSAQLPSSVHGPPYTGSVILSPFSNNLRAPRALNHHHHRAAPYGFARPKLQGESKAKTRGRPRGSRSKFLQDQPAHAYILPEGEPLNFTIVEIISILPNWFRNRDLAQRFLNNGITAGVHLLILEEHRNIDLPTEVQRLRARENISEAYRRAMRMTDPEWTKVHHRAPVGWDEDSMLVNYIIPEDARKSSWIYPASIPFKALANDLKKLPEGHDAGDLTRALSFALNHAKDDGSGTPVDFLFPDDIHNILNHIGRIKVTPDHTDTYILARYDERQCKVQKERLKAQANGGKPVEDKNTHLDSQDEVQKVRQPAIKRHLQRGEHLFEEQLDQESQPRGPDVTQHGQHTQSQLLPEANFQSPFATTNITQSSHHTALPPAGMGVLVPRGRTVRGRQIRREAQSESEFDPTYWSPYAELSVSEYDTTALMVAELTSWIAENDRATAGAALVHQDEAFAHELAMQWDSSLDRQEVASSVQTADDGFFPPIPDVCLIPEPEQEDDDRILFEIAGPDH